LVNEKTKLNSEINEMHAFRERFLDRLNDTYLKVKKSSPVDLVEEGNKIVVTAEFDKKLLKREIIELYNTYANEQNMKGVLQTKEEKKRNERQFLEKSVDGLKNKMKTQRKGMNLENNKIMKENMYLISQINKLRTDLNYLHNENQEMDTQKDFGKTYGQSEIAERIAEVESQVKEIEKNIEKLKHSNMIFENELSNN
jgi:hypothetical protein